MQAGMVAGCVDQFGYVRVIIKGRNYRAHRIIWLWVHGKWPENELDHIDGVRSHNWLKNLREATRAQNMLNKRRYKNNSTGFIGVTLKYEGKYEARYKFDGKQVSIGFFDTAEEAAAAYQAAIAYRGEFRPQAAGAA